MPTNIVVPDLGESVVEATVLHWSKQEGERVASGETLVELETEKVNLQVSSPSAGVLARIAHQAGDDVKIGDVLGVIEPVPVQDSNPPTATKQPPEESNRTTAVRERPPERESPHTPFSERGGEVRQGVNAERRAEPQESAGLAHPEARAAESDATPLAHRMAEEYGIDLRRVRAGSPDQRITKQDVEMYIEQQQATPSLPAPRAAVVERANREERVKLSRRRQTIARRLVEAQHAAAMLTTFNEVDMSAVIDMRRQHKATLQDRYGVSLGITSFFVKAAIGALKAFPRLNAEIQGDEMVFKHYHDIGIAVGAAEGLVVPVLRDVDRMSFVEIEKKIKELAEKAEDGTLALEDLRGGTFTITNGGVFGSLLSTPILNPPQVGILGMHKIEERPIARQGQVVVRPMMYVALSYDHRLVDGREAVQFLVRVKELIEDPAALLLEG